ncbi:MAG TPA: thioredoxin domain-containing protein, partial [Blastocatellia bacterium]|nr:thioredoxin domain-containing protein [Blastocatellia bacterium]
HEELIARTKDYYDNATPGGNSVAAASFLKLSLLSADSIYQRDALTILRTLHQPMTRYPGAFGYLLCALDFYLSEAKEVAIIGEPDSHEVRSFVEEVYSQYLPNKVVALARAGDAAAAESIKLLADRPALEGKATAYVCRNYTCLAPATSIQELRERLSE